MIWKKKKKKMVIAKQKPERKIEEKKKTIALKFAKGTRSLGDHPPKFLWIC